ncbi:MAG: flagellar basal body-associated FliL family protein, partial [Pseudomonadales bacterium]|nr:flagellar basal body-associated FliL family protein [Pseudomonadales bacterium]
LMNSSKFLQVGLGVSTQYDDKVMANVEAHQLGLRSEILNTISEFSEADIQGKAGREQLAKALTESINQKLIALEDFGGVQEVHFTSFVLQ